MDSDDTTSPGATTELSETEIPSPSSGPAYADFPDFNPEQHNASTRRWLAFSILGVLVAMYGVGVTAFMLNAINFEQLTQMIAAFSGLQTLAAAALGFYFAKEK